MDRIISYIIAALGIILTVIIYLKSRKVKRLSYASKSFNLLSDSTASLPSFSASFDGQPLTNLTASKVIVWNSGTDIIEPGDFATTDPLIMTLPDDAAILSIRLHIPSSNLDHSNPNCINVTIDKSCQSKASITFEYLARNEGFVASLLHTGKPDTMLRIEGTIKGTSSPQRIVARKWESWVRFIATFMGFGSIMAAMWGFGNLTDNGAILAFALFASFFLLITGAGWFDRWLKRKAGKTLDSAYEEEFSPGDFT